MIKTDKEKNLYSRKQFLRTAGSTALAGVWFGVILIAVVTVQDSIPVAKW